MAMLQFFYNTKLGAERNRTMTKDDEIDKNESHHSHSISFWSQTHRAAARKLIGGVINTGIINDDLIPAFIHDTTGTRTAQRRRPQNGEQTKPVT